MSIEHQETIEIVESNDTKTQTTTSIPTKSGIMQSKWKLSLVFLFVVGLSLECVNITLGSKNETETDSLRAFQSSDTLLTLTNLLRAAKDDDTVSTEAPPQNKSSSLCTDMAEFRLEASDKRVHVCTYAGQVRVDIRQFINERATIKGIYLNMGEFLALSRVIPMIQVEVNRQLGI